jgi:hypothetical protein
MLFLVNSGTDYIAKEGSSSCRYGTIRNSTKFQEADIGIEINRCFNIGKYERDISKCIVLFQSFSNRI